MDWHKTLRSRGNSGKGDICGQGSRYSGPTEYGYIATSAETLVIFLVSVFFKNLQPNNQNGLILGSGCSEIHGEAQKEQ